MRHSWRFGGATIGAFGLLLLAGDWLGGSALHPAKRLLTPQLILQAGGMLARLGASGEDFSVRAPDGVLLSGWKVHPQAANGDWVLLFHGVADNRMGVLGEAEFLARDGYSLVMMDARAHGDSGGALATYGWKERYDTQATVQALYASEKVHCLFAIGESMGAAIALQSAAIELRITGVVAEAAFSDLREVSYDYAGLRLSPWLGKTLFRPVVWAAISAMQREGSFQADDVSPEKAVALRAFPVLLICGTLDRKVPCRHSERILRAASGIKSLWIVQGAGHTEALGKDPRKFEKHVLEFFKSTGCAV